GCRGIEEEEVAEVQPAKEEEKETEKEKEKTAAAATAATATIAAPTGVTPVPSEPDTPVSATSAVHSTQSITPSTASSKREKPGKDKEKDKKESVVTEAVPAPASAPAPAPAPTATTETKEKQKDADITAKPKSTSSRAAIPVVPVVPIPVQRPTSPEKSAACAAAAAEKKEEAEEERKPTTDAKQQPQPQPQPQPSEPAPATEETKPVTAQAPSAAPSVAPPARAAAAPKSWAELVRKNASSAAATTNSANVAGTAATAIPGAISSPAAIAGPGGAKSSSMRDVLASVTGTEAAVSKQVAFLEPRGLVNTGNMCYMNSVLQILAFCPPFFTFLDRVGAQAAHTIGGEFPLIDAMIMFLKEFRILETGTTTEQLRAKLKTSQFEQYGDSFTPEYVYEVIRRLPRFRDMRQGHQQDAQEFLGFLLEELHEECALALKQAGAVQQNVHQPNGTDEDESQQQQTQNDGWMQVGHKQRAAVTRSSGETSGETAITRIYGGKLRSEFRVPGNKISVTLEPYQSLQLDIGSPQVNTIVDALKNLTTPETMHGDFTTAKGTKSSATKQVFIESLPSVLILHLKRFQYDATTHGTQKIWKKIGYPLDLELPLEVLAPQRRNTLTPPPKYRLIGVIYHHGKNAGGGHYTVDVRRQDGREWIRIDDTVIRRVRPEDVAGASGSDEDSKALAAALEKQKTSSSKSNNIFESFGGDESDDNNDSEHGWSQVNGTGSSGAKKSAAAAAAAA
ncbi:hypothetical protein KEM56_003567, partial [Ascosphaera pollenicola]